MRERIVLAPGLDGGELLSSLALHGVSSIGLRICGLGELARLALMRSGTAVTENFISAGEETAVAAEAVKDEPYFGRVSYADVQEITACIRTIRSLVSDPDEMGVLERTLSQGIFGEKNTAIFHVCRRYMEILAERKLVDSVSLARKALRECGKIRAEFLTLKEYPLSPLEKALLGKLSGNSVEETDLQALFGVGEGVVRIDSFKNCYGSANEVETILEDVYSGKRLDQCTVAVSDAETYGQLFFDYALLYHIPISFGCGIPVANSNPARLLTLYDRWSKAGVFSGDALTGMLSCDVFRRDRLAEQFRERGEDPNWGALFEVLAGLRLTNSAAVNEQRLSAFRQALEEEAALLAGQSRELQKVRDRQSCLPYLEVLGRELALPTEEFIYKFAYLRKGDSTDTERLLMTLDRSALTAVCEELRIIRRSGLDLKPEEQIPKILRRNVCRQRSEAGKLYVTEIGGAFPAVRRNLYLAGLSASKYPGSPKENYLLLDADLKLFGEAAETLTSDELVLQKREQLHRLVRFASALGSRVSVSFAGLNVSELKEDNPSSVIYDLLREEHGAALSVRELDENIRKVGYFEPAISPVRLVGEAYIKGNPPAWEKTDGRGTDTVNLALEKEYSPSALEIYFSCPRRFFLRYILRIPEPEETDPFEIVSAADIGTLAHSMMEQLGGAELSRDEFLKTAGDCFDRFIRQHPPLIADRIAPEIERFLEMMETAYAMETGREVLLEEEEIHCTHETGVKLHGYPDRVEKMEDGSCLIVDFKSKRKIDHLADDIDTCLQVVLYAYLMEQRGLKVSGAEYRYIRLGETVTCRYDDEMKRQLAERLTAFRSSMESGTFPLPELPQTAKDGNDPCQYCKFPEICGKKRTEGEEE